MHILAHPNVVQQVSAQQPNLTVLLVCLVVPGQLPGMLSHCRIFDSVAEHHYSAFRIGVLLVQLGLTFGVVMFLRSRYSSAIWTARQPGRPRFLLFVAILLPLFLFHLFHTLRAVQTMLVCARLPDQAQAAQWLASIYHQAWDREGVGTYLGALVSASVTSLFLAPVLEEPVLSGFVVNVIAKRYGFIAAAVGAALGFALMHAFKVGLGVQLLPLFFAGLSYATIRICTGSLLLAVLGHCTINGLVSIPQWVIAALCFARP